MDLKKLELEREISQYLPMSMVLKFGPTSMEILYHGSAIKIEVLVICQLSKDIFISLQKGKEKLFMIFTT